MFKLKLILILIVIIIMVGAIYFVNTVYSPMSNDASLVYFNIESGEGVNQISLNLREEKLINSELVFETYIWLKRAEGNLMAGEHKLATDMSIKDIFEVLTTGINVVNNETQITIIEGWKADEIGQYLETQRLVQKQEFLEAIAIEKWRNNYDFLKTVTTNNLEGFLFPDTYRVFNDATVEDIIGKMLDNFDRQLSFETRDEIDRQNKTIFEVVNLASIVEREALTKEDKRMVADVFLKRLNLNMGLESDATINYVTGKSDRRPTYSDLAVDSLYNTYKYRGLPPGPISNPGIDSIMAVVYPQTNAFYFFLMDIEGKAYYAETFSGHQENIRKYLN